MDRPAPRTNGDRCRRSAPARRVTPDAISADGTSCAAFGTARSRLPPSICATSLATRDQTVVRRQLLGRQGWPEVEIVFPNQLNRQFADAGDISVVRRSSSSLVPKCCGAFGPERLQQTLDL